MCNLHRGTLLVVVLAAVLYTGQCQLYGLCTPSNDTSQVQFWLFTRPNTSNYVVLNSFNEVNISKPTKLVIHGWGGNGDIDYIHVIKEAYLQEYDYNVISVDYSTLAGGQYPSAYCNVAFVGTVLGQFICQLMSRGVILADIHIVGHSLGAHVAGCAGRQVKMQCSTSGVGRITGLDPAGPIFDISSNDIRLDEGDATFVDVIHTDQDQYGTIWNCGHVDFFPNCGLIQPGCTDNLVNITSPLAFVSCSHQRSCYLFAESIERNCFLAVGCGKCLNILFSTPSNDIYMGESCRTKPNCSEYFVHTNADSPYATCPT